MQGQSVSAVVNYDTQLLKLYTIHKKISNGSFGTVFQVTNKQSNVKSALKVELIQPKIKPTLKKEIEIMKILENVDGVPKMYNHGKTQKLYFLELQILDRDLSVMVTKNVVTPLPYLCELTIKLINILENIHSKGVIHRDLKPQNIMLQGDSIYLIDFGISEIILNNTVKKRAFVGTPRYASIAAHKGYSQTPIDEIESLMYIIIFIFKRTLPWMDINKKQNKMQYIMEIKMNVNKQQLCKGLPSCFEQTFHYISQHQNHLAIDYSYLRQNFVRYLQEIGSFSLSKIKGVKMSIPHPDVQNKQNTERRRFSQIDPQVLGLLLKQRQFKNGGKRQSMQTNFLTIPESLHEIKTSSVLTVQLVTTQKAVASEQEDKQNKQNKQNKSQKQMKQKSKQSSSKQIHQKRNKLQDRATLEIVGQIDQRKSEQQDINQKMRSYCIDRTTRGGMKTSTIKIFQFQ